MTSRNDEPSGSFTTYLEMLQSQGSEPESPAAQRSLLAALHRHGALTMDQWLRAGGLSVVGFADALKALQEEGLIAETGPDDGRRFTLTDEGRGRAEHLG